MHLGSGGRKGLVSQPQTFSIHAQTFRHIRFVFNKAAKVIIRGGTFCILIINVVNALLFVAKWVGGIDYAPPDIQFGDATFRGYAARSPALFYFATQKASLPDPKRQTPPS